ncbi:MAG TPA: hypothetical protein VK571_04755 [Gemmatimonadaceae bacterium]|nr:hypothetical protein [Gemmatimonadaceae bacterium]
MSSSLSESSDRDPLQKQLDNAENELRRRLEEACEAEADGVSTESTEEVRKLEDNLLAAASAAKQTIAVRTQMKRRRYAGRERPIKIDVAADRDTQAPAPNKGSPESKADEGGEQPTMGVREFTDDQARPWRAWLVVPGLRKASSSSPKLLGDFQNGWICFEGVDRPARRRLPYHQADWPNISDEELKQLVGQAIDAPIREKKPPGQALTDR